MYVIREKRNKVILHMLQSAPGENREAREIYPEFDPETMEFGKTEEQSIPPAFTIEDGVVIAVEPSAERVRGAARGTPKPATPSLDELKEAAIAHFSQQSFELRRALVPDYQLQNAALGLYDEQQTAAIRDIAKAFRDEFYRLKSAIEKARSIKALSEVTPNFPTEVAPAGPTPNLDSTETPEPVRDAEPIHEVGPRRISRERPRRPNS
jgi:hypothetical protein